MNPRKELATLKGHYYLSIVSEISCLDGPFLRCGHKRVPCLVDNTSSITNLNKHSQVKEVVDFLENLSIVDLLRCHDNIAPYQTFILHLL